MTAGVPSSEKVEMSAATVRLGLLLRDVVLNGAPQHIQNTVAVAAQRVEDEARQQLHGIREAARHMTPEDATALALALARSGEPTNESLPRLPEAG
jgi:hypothetical protein